MRHALIGYARVSKTDGSQSLDLQRDALRAAGVNDAVNVYHDLASGVRDDRPGVDSCLRAAAEGQRARGLEARPPRPQPRPSDTTTAAGLVFGIFAALAEFERELIRERTVARDRRCRSAGLGSTKRS